MDQWISANKAIKLFKTNQNQLDELEKQKKVKTMKSVGNKLYLFSNLEEHIPTPLKVESVKTNAFKNIFYKIFSWFVVGLFIINV